MSDAASLGQLAVHQGLITVAELRQLADELRALALRREPTSLARLLIGRGLPLEGVRGVLAHGTSFSSVACDACGELIPQAQLGERSEQPCPRCGSMVLGFRAFAPPGAPTRRATTDRYPVVLPIPAECDPKGQETNAYGTVLPLPEAPVVNAQEAASRFEDLLSKPVSAEWLAGAPQGLGVFQSSDGELGGVTMGPNDLTGAMVDLAAEVHGARAALKESQARDAQAKGAQAKAESDSAAAADADSDSETPVAEMTRQLSPDEVAEVLSAPPPQPAPTRKRRSRAPLVIVLLLLLGLIAGGVALLLNS